MNNKFTNNSSMRTVRGSFRLLRKLALAAIGLIVLFVGIVMIVAPGPAFILLPAGLAILALEFAWAKSWLKKLRVWISSANARRRTARQHGRETRY